MHACSYKFIYSSATKDQASKRTFVSDALFIAVLLFFSALPILINKCLTLTLVTASIVQQVHTTFKACAALCVCVCNMCMKENLISPCRHTQPFAIQYCKNIWIAYLLHHGNLPCQAFSLSSS